MIEYELVNMFTERPFGGSVLGVVPAAQALSTEAMQAIAAEINATETAFILPPTSPRADYRVRVFSPIAESPFGEHSSVGNAATLVRLGVIAAGPVTQECGSTFQSLVATVDGATLVRQATVAEHEVDASVLLDALGLSNADVADAVPRAVGFGVPFPFLPVNSSALDKVRVDYEKLSAAEIAALCLFNWDPETRTARSRVFAPGYGIPEDPACAPIGLAFGAWLVGAGCLPGQNGSYDYTIRQGIEMGREATLVGSITVQDGIVAEGHVAGRVTAVTTGQIALPKKLIQQG